MGGGTIVGGRASFTQEIVNIAENTRTLVRTVQRSSLFSSGAPVTEKPMNLPLSGAQIEQAERQCQNGSTSTVEAVPHNDHRIYAETTDATDYVPASSPE